MQHPSSRKRSRVRRHRVPYPLTDTAELFEGGEILRDFGGDLAVVLWKTYKNVMLWAGAHPEERAGLFASGAGERRREEIRATAPEASVAEPLLEVASLLDAPAAVGSATLGGACRALSDWAAGREAPASALLFMQAAALASPLDADAACSVGRMARNRAEYARAETWFRQAVVAARESGNWSAYAQAYVGLGKVFWQRGALPAARRCMLRAYKTATRHHFRELRGWALSDLGGIAIHAGRWDEARSYIRAALTLYGPRHRLACHLVHDLAYAWITAGWFAPATRVLTAISPSFAGRDERLYLNSSLARAAGGAGEEVLFDRAVAQVVQLVDDPALAAFAPGVWLDVAHGGSSLRRWELARTAAETALRLATIRGEGRIRLEADSILGSIAAERAVERARRTEVAPLPAQIAELAADVLAFLDDTGEADTPVLALSAS